MKKATISKSINERVEKLDSGVIVCNTASEVANLFRNKPMIYRGFYDMNKDWYCIADASGIMHADMFLEMYRQGFYPEFETKREADQYYCKNMDLWQQGTPVSILTFMFSPNKENKAILGSDYWKNCFTYDCGNLFTRNYPDNQLPLITALGDYSKEEYNKKELAMNIAEELRKYIIEPETDEKKKIKKQVEQDFEENKYAEGTQYEVLMDGEPLGYPVTATLEEIKDKIEGYKIEYPNHTFDYREYKHVTECVATFSNLGTAPTPTARRKKKMTTKRLIRQLKEALGEKKTLTEFYDVTGMDSIEMEIVNFGWQRGNCKRFELDGIEFYKANDEDLKDAVETCIELEFWPEWQEQGLVSYNVDSVQYDEAEGTGTAYVGLFWDEDVD